MAAAALVTGSIGMLVALATPPFAGADEAQHVAYALQVSDGRLPDLHTPVRSRIPGMPGLPADCEVPAEQVRTALERGGAEEHPGAGGDAAGLPPCAIRDGAGPSVFDLIYTANHPPLFYLLQSVPLGVGEDSGHPLAGMRAARTLNVGFGLAALVAAALLVRGLLPARPDLAVGTAALTGTTGLFVLTAGQVYNDALAVATITGATAATVALARRGPAPAVLAALVLLLPAAALSRASGAVAAMLLVPAAGVALGLSLGRRGLSRARRAAWGACLSVLLALLVAAAAGWFYRRNVSRYGDPTAAGQVAEMFPTATGPRPMFEVLTSGEFWWYVYRGLFGRQSLLTGPALDVAAAVGLTLAVGLPAAAARAAWRRARSRREPTRPREPAGERGTRGSGLFCWLLVAAQTVLVVATLVGYVASGGASFARYLLPALPVFALGVAAACGALPAARRGLPTLAAVGALAVTTIVMLGRELTRNDPAPPPGTLDRLRSALAAAPGLGADRAEPLLVTLLALGALGLALLGLAMWRLAATSVPTWRPPAPPPTPVEPPPA